MTHLRGTREREGEVKEDTYHVPFSERSADVIGREIQLISVLRCMPKPRLVVATTFSRSFLLKLRCHIQFDFSSIPFVFKEYFP